MTQINLERMAPAQIVGFIEKGAGECMTPSPSEERNWSQKGPAPGSRIVRRCRFSDGTFRRQ